MKILHITQFLDIGGLEKIIFLLMQQQIKNNHDVELIVYDSKKRWVQKFKEAGIIIHSDFQKSQGYDFKLLSYINSFFDRFDVIHTHDLNPLLYAGPIRFYKRLAFKKRTCLIHTTHGLNHIKSSPKTYYYEKIASYFADSIIAVSPKIKKFYIEKIKCKKEMIFNINNGTYIPSSNIQKDIPTNIIKRKEDICKKYNINPELDIWLTVARVVPLKDQILLANIMRDFPNKQLLIIGPSGDDRYWQKLNQNLAKNVFLLGGQDNIVDFLQISKLFLSASLHEGIPVAVLEAGAFRVPCILSDIAGHKILSKNNNSKNIVLYFKKSSRIDLIKTISYFLKNEHLKTILSNNFYNMIKTNFSDSKMYQEYQQAYTTTLKRIQNKC